ncbi:MAG: PqqD family protein [Bacteroidota bacterium]|nr:PqqD family protein [Bacteroidota bacterium]
MDIDKIKYIRKPNLIAKKIGDEYIIVQIVDKVANMNALYTLNETGAFIWENLDSGKTIEQIVSLVCNEFDTDLETTKNDVIRFINEIYDILIIEDEK